MTKRYRIAIIEDSKAEIALLRIALDKAGVVYELSEYRSGDSALQSLSDGVARPDVILTDAKMPRMNLDDLLSGLKQVSKLHGVPIIVLSGMTDPHLIRRALANGARDYIFKPSDLQGWFAIGHRIKEWVEKSARD